MAIAQLVAAVTIPFAPAVAQTYPTKPIRLIVPFPPGGGTDIASRVLAGQIAETTKWSIIIDNKPGAGGNIGVEQAAKAAPDGYTIVMGQTSNLAVNPALYAKLPYDPLADLKPIALVASSPLVIVVAATSKLRTLADMIVAGKAAPGELTMASAGNGTIGHLGGEMLQLAAGFKLQHIPYRGASPALIDVLGGRIDVYLSTIPAALPHIKAGKLRAIATTALTRTAELAEVPTVAESGQPGFEAASWYGILVPAGVPDAIVGLLNTEIVRALSSDGVKRKFAAEGLIPLGGPPETFRDLLARELPRWAEVVRASGAKID